MKTPSQLPKYIKDLDMSIRCFNVLTMNNIGTTEQLLEMSKYDILELRGASKKTVQEIVEVLDEYLLVLPTLIQSFQIYRRKQQSKEYLSTLHTISKEAYKTICIELINAYPIFKVEVSQTEVKITIPL